MCALDYCFFFASAHKIPKMVLAILLGQGYKQLILGLDFVETMYTLSLVDQEQQTGQRFTSESSLLSFKVWILLQYLLSEGFPDDTKRILHIFPPSSLINLIIPKNCTPHVALIRGSRHLLLYVYVKASDMNSIILAFISLKTTWISPLHSYVNQPIQAAVKN